MKYKIYISIMLYPMFFLTNCVIATDGSIISIKEFKNRQVILQASYTLHRMYNDLNKEIPKLKRYLHSLDPYSCNVDRLLFIQKIKRLLRNIAVFELQHRYTEKSKLWQYVSKHIRKYLYAQLFEIQKIECFISI